MSAVAAHDFPAFADAIAPVEDALEVNPELGAEEIFDAFEPPIVALFSIAKMISAIQAHGAVAWLQSEFASPSGIKMVRDGLSLLGGVGASEVRKSLDAMMKVAGRVGDVMANDIIREHGDEILDAANIVLAEADAYCARSVVAA